MIWVPHFENDVVGQSVSVSVSRIGVDVDLDKVKRPLELIKAILGLGGGTAQAYHRARPELGV